MLHTTAHDVSPYTYAHVSTYRLGAIVYVLPCAYLCVGVLFTSKEGPQVIRFATALSQQKSGASQAQTRGDAAHTTGASNNVEQDPNSEIHRGTIAHTRVHKKRRLTGARPDQAKPGERSLTAARTTCLNANLCPTLLGQPNPSTTKTNNNANICPTLQDNKYQAVRAPGYKPQLPS